MSDNMMIKTLSTWNYMADGSIVLDEPGQPLFRIAAGAVAVLQSNGPAIWNPSVQKLTIEEAAAWTRPKLCPVYNKAKIMEFEQAIAAVTKPE